MVRAAVGAAAVPASSAAVLARSMLPPGPRPKIVTTLHGTETTLLGRDPGYGPAIRYALACSDAVTVVSEYLRDETRRVLDVDRPADPRISQNRGARRCQNRMYYPGKKVSHP
jgi:hypothetical protein